MCNGNVIMDITQMNEMVRGLIANQTVCNQIKMLQMITGIAADMYQQGHEQ